MSRRHWRLGCLLLAGWLALLSLGACSPFATSARTPTLAPSTTPTAVIPLGAPACQANQLAGQFRAGGYATGNATGELLLRNVSPSACSLHGPVGFYATDAQGKRIAATGMNQPQTLAPVVLTPNTPAAPPSVEPTTGAYLVLRLIGAYRDDPTAANGLCSAADEVTPAQLVISVGAVSVAVTNYDPAGMGFTAIYGCHGVILGEGASLSSSSSPAEVDPTQVLSDRLSHTVQGPATRTQSSVNVKLGLRQQRLLGTTWLLPASISLDTWSRPVEEARHVDACRLHLS